MNVVANLEHQAQDFLPQIVVKIRMSGFSSRNTGGGIFAAEHVGKSVWDGRTLGRQGRKGRPAGGSTGRLRLAESNICIA
jgi:hypothetical protein